VQQPLGGVYGWGCLLKGGVLKITEQEGFLPEIALDLIWNDPTAQFRNEVQVEELNTTRFRLRFCDLLTPSVVYSSG